MFFDNASTTKIDNDIIDQFRNINDKYYFNPGALYSVGRDVKNLIEESRKNILDKIGGGDGKLIFTGSATEANNQALIGYMKKHTRKILVSMGEHPSVYNTALELKNKGFNVEFVKLNSFGQIDIEDYKLKLTSDVDFISIIHVSNETGAINDIDYLVRLAREVNPKVVFHSDGVQALGKINVDVENLDVDMYTMSAHKIHGMKGVGALYLKKRIDIKPIIFGGGQENGLRSGTENLLGIYSMSEALRKCVIQLEENYNKVLSLKNRFIQRLSGSGLPYEMHSFDNGSPYIVSVSFSDCRSETLLNMLSDKGVYVGNGSACSSKKSDNRVLSAMGVGVDSIKGNLRISFSRYNEIDEIDEMCDVLINIVKTYRDLTK